MRIDNPLDEEERLCSLIDDSIEPKLVPNVELMTVAGKTLLTVEVFLGGSRPHWIASEGPDAVYVRLGSTNRRANRELIAELKRLVEHVAFDELPKPQLSIDDVDIENLNSMFNEGKHLSEQQLLTLKLVVREQGRLVPTNGAILLFGKHREQHFPDAWVQCARFKGLTKSSMMDHIEIHDHLPAAVENMMTFLKKHAMQQSDFSELKRKDSWNIPITILREAIVNAVVHADYSQIGAPIRLAFFDDRIEIDNPGILLPGLTLEDLVQGVSKIRNRVIARIFRELNLIEQWGSGFPRIFEEAKILKLQPPELKELGTQIRFIVHLADPDTSNRGRIGIGAESGVEWEMALQILGFLKSEDPGKKEIAVKLGRAKPHRYLDELMRRMLNDGLVNYTIPDKPNSRLQKYHLSQKGKKHVKSKWD